MLPDLSPIISSAKEAFDDLITGNAGITCILVSQGVTYPCDNCAYDPIGKKSAGRYLSGGPLSFNDGSICPRCGGEGALMMEYEESIKMTVDWHLTGEKNKYNQPLTNFQFPSGTIRTRGFLTDMPKVQKCVYMVISDDSSPYNNWKYKLSSEPVDDFVFTKNRYFSAYWTRVG